MEIGTWARAGGLVGMVSRIDPDGTVTLFNPGDRQIVKASRAAVQTLPTGMIEARVALRMVVPHGLNDDSMRRWLATLIDPVLRERAVESLREMGLDPMAMELQPRVEVREIS